MVILSCVLILAYIAHSRPFLDSYMNKIEIMNEIFVTLTSYFLLLYSDTLLTPHNSSDIHVVDMDQLVLVGWLNAAFIGVIVLTNLSIVTYQSLKSTYRGCRRRCGRMCIGRK